jgi:hypothetical protein
MHACIEIQMLRESNILPRPLSRAAKPFTQTFIKKHKFQIKGRRRILTLHFAA